MRGYEEEGTMGDIWDAGVLSNGEDTMCKYRHGLMQLGR